MYMYIYIHIYIYIYIYVIHVCTYICVYVYTYIHIYIMHIYNTNVFVCCNYWTCLGRVLSELHKRVCAFFLVCKDALCFVYVLPECLCVAYVCACTYVYVFPGGLCGAYACVCMYVCVRTCSMDVPVPGLDDPACTESGSGGHVVT